MYKALLGVFFFWVTMLFYLLTLVQSQSNHHRSGQHIQSSLLVHLHPGQTSTLTPSQPSRQTRVKQQGGTKFWACDK